MRRIRRKTAALTPTRVGTSERTRIRRYRRMQAAAPPLAGERLRAKAWQPYLAPGPGPRTEQPKDAGPRPPQTYALVRRRWARAEDAGMRRSSATALLLQPDRAEAVIRRGEVLLVVDGALHDVDQVGREGPDHDRLLDHQPLHAIVDLLALGRIDAELPLVEERVDVGVVDVVPLLLRRV